MTILNLRIWEHLLSLESHCKEHCILCECVCAIPHQDYKDGSAN